MREASVSDRAAVLRIAEQIYSSNRNSAAFNWPPSVLMEELTQVKTLLLDAEGIVSSFICYRDLPDTLEISVLATAPEAQRTGAQSSLIQYLQELAAKQCKGILLEVHQQNQRALQLYDKMGFQEIHRRRRYYSDGGDAVVMLWNAEKEAGC